MSPDRDDLAPTEATPPSAPSHEHGRFLPGTVLGNRYRIVSLAGRGGMGEVYRADDLKIGQPVALKFLPADLERDPDRLERLLGEVRIARQVSHPNVCRVYDVGEYQGHHFITMEYVDGEDLAALLRRIGRLPQEKALDLARQIAAGLAAAHVQGIVHRDLKPANIMLDGRGRARITDFGLAAAAEALRGKEAQWGTPAYMAPEQLAGEEVTTRTDIYALGLVLYEMFTGKRASEGPSRSEPGQGGYRIPARPSAHVPGLDPAVDAAILECLEPEPARRPSSAVQLLAALPGGDPLAAAVRAGETPSPEMVAAAGEEGLVPSAKVWGVLGLALLATVAALILTARSTGLDQVPMAQSPEVLRERAREMARRLGDEMPERFSEWWFDLDDGYLDWSRERPQSTWVADARPSAVRFYYRKSPRPIYPTGSLRPSRRDPAFSWTGEVCVALDPQGRLMEFARLGRQRSPPDTGRGPTDWNALLALTGIDITNLRSAEPLWTPDVPFDDRRAWLGSDGGVSVRLEAAAWKGKPVWLRTFGPWERAERDIVAPQAALGRSVFVFMVLVIVLVFVVLARHNLRLGRSDRRGAARVAAVVFLTFALGYSLEYRSAMDPDRIWLWLLRLPYFGALEAWLYYLGIEPYLRRRWPHRLIAWTRLLDGRVVDPLVGKELLVGVLVGSGVTILFSLPGILGRHPDPDLLSLGMPFGRAADFWGVTTSALGDPIMNGLGSYAALLLFRLVLRRDRLAWIVLAVMWFIVNVPRGGASIPEWVSLAVGSTTFVLVMRVGLLATVTTWVVYRLEVVNGPLTLDLSRWYAWRTGVVALLLLAIALWGFRALMGRRKIFSAAALEG